MLKKQFRLPPSRHRSSASFFATPFFTLRRWENTLAHNRFGFIVSKKVDKRAVVRNRVRRMIRSYIEQDQQHFLGKSDILFFAKRDAVGASKEILFQEVAKALHHVLKP